jgi:Zn-finger nucleic acid-binding protein
MQCPVDGATLLLSERQGVEIDYCPTCRGIWLDRGELDKLLRRDDDEWQRSEDEWRRHDDRRDRPPAKKKKRWLSEVFEFD